MLSLKELSQELGVSPGSFPPGSDEMDSRAGNQQTLDGLNKRLEEYLKKVNRLKDKNQKLQIDINAKMSKPHELDWKQTSDVQEQIKKITQENAKRLLKINKCTNLEKKLEEEARASRKVEKELKELQMVLVDTKQTQKHLQKEMELLTSKLVRLTTEHQKELDSLCENLTSEEDSQNSELADMVKAIRKRYDEITKNNMKEMEKWYKDQLERIKQQDAQNLEALKAGNSERTKLLTDKQNLEIEINTLITKNKRRKKTLEEIREFGFKDKAGDLEKKLEELISQIDEQKDKNQDLLNITGSLQVQIQKYKALVGSKQRDASSPSSEDKGEKNESKKNESKKNESKKNESKKNESKKNESKKNDS